MPRDGNGRQKVACEDAQFLSLYPCRLYTVFNLAFGIARFDFVLFLCSLA